MGGLIRSADWAATSLGTFEQWPESLKSALSISLNSAFPIAIYWGETFILLYNDAWSSIPGEKHPWCLGKEGAVVWPEIWDGLQAEFESVLQNGESIRRDNALLLMRRYGYAEECYFDYTLSPIVDIDGKIGGVFNAVIETSYKVINERRNAVLLQFLQGQSSVLSVQEGGALIRDILEGAKSDIPFCALYIATGAPYGALELIFITGISEGHVSGAEWLFSREFDGTGSYFIHDLGQVLGAPVYSEPGEACVEAVIVPLAAGEAKVQGHIILGVSPRKRLDDDYRRFLETVGLHAGTILNSGYAYEQGELLIREQSLNEELAAANEELTAINDELHLTQERLNKLNIELEERVRNRTVALAESERRFRFMLNAVPQQVWTARPNGSLDYVNQIVIDDFDVSAEDVMHSGWQRFVHPEDWDGAQRAWQISLESGTPFMREFRLRVSGAYLWHLSRAVPLLEHGNITLWIGTNTNIEVQKNNEQKKDEFLSIASHELKTPLTSIRAFNQLMVRTNDAKKLKGFAEKSALHIYRLEKLISDLLDVTKINAGKMNYLMQLFNFKEMVANAVESVQHMSPKHKIVLESTVDVLFKGDQLRLEQVMHNFLSNAVKYSPGANRVIVRCDVVDGSIVVAVEDFGVGIAKKHLDRLFDRYYRVDNTAMRFEGLGLGLFISSEILKRHNGSFWIESAEGKGSIFYFRLPIEDRDNSVPRVNSETYYEDSKITVVYNAGKERIEATWRGFQDLNSVKHGCMIMLQMMKRNRCHKVLNDNSEVMGTWSEAADWGREEWFPMMQRSGLRLFAWILSPSSFSQMSAHKSAEVIEGNITFQFFTHRKDAERWISSK